MSAERATVRQATEADVEPVLDLLTHYDVPRSRFEPLYYDDPCYRPAHSWVVEAEGSLVAHLRLFPRTLRLATGRLPVAGIGNVVTARQWRGHGHMRRLLHGVLTAAEREPHALAVLWTDLPSIYARHGFDTLTVQETAAVVPEHKGRCELSVFRSQDLPEVERFARRYGATLSGTTVRSHEYWQGQLRWLDEDRAGFLVARDRGGDVIGYVRSRRGRRETRVLELAVLRDDLDTARTLLGAVTRPSRGALRGLLPAGHRELLHPDSRVQVHDVPGPMLRPLNPEALAGALSHVLSVRLAAQDVPALDIAVDATQGRVSPHGTGPLLFRAEPVEVRALPEGVDAQPALHCSPASLAHLMLGGAPPEAPDWLARLLPARDWVLWDADRV